MIDKFVEHWEDGKSELEEKYSKVHPSSYSDIVLDVIRILQERIEHGGPDRENIHRIDDGDWQGTLVFVIPEDTYQPSTYFYVRIAYGSCSGCDALMSIRGMTRDDEPTEEQTESYMRMALHVVQSLKKMDPESYV